MTFVDTARADAAATGSIRVSYESGSIFLSSELPHQLRNSDMRVLDSGRGNHTYRVPPGLYSVEAVSPDGERQSFLVDVVAAKASEVTIEHRESPPHFDGKDIATVAASAPVQPQAPQAPSKRQRPAKRQPPARQLDEAVVGPSVVCATCASINAASRTFCHRCGSKLEPVAPPRSQSWWQRLSRWNRPSDDDRGKQHPESTSAPDPIQRSRSAEPTWPGGPPGPDHGGPASVRTDRAEMLAWEIEPVGARLRNHDVKLTAMVGCALQSTNATQLLFRPDGDLEEPAHVTFEIAEQRVVMSLPIDPQASFPLGGAAVTATCDVSGTVRLVAGFTDQRRVARVIDAMSGVGSLAGSESMVREASNLLLHKYADAPAAALGALMMQRLGRLDQRESWVSNLAAGFTWLPDGKALHAALLRDGDDNQRRSGLRLLLEAADQRPMFTDGLSLMINLLRHWPGDERSAERRAAIDNLGAHIVAADLDAACLTVTTGDQR